MNITIEHNLRSNNYLTKLFDNSDAFMLVGQENNSYIEDILLSDILFFISSNKALFYDNLLLLNKTNEIYDYVMENNIKQLNYDVSTKTLFEVDEEILFYIKLKYEEELIESFWDFQSEINIKLRYEKI